MRLRRPYFEARLGSDLRFVLAIFLSSFSLIDLAMLLDAPFRLDFGASPRLAAKAAPAAICCFFDFAGMLASNAVGQQRLGEKQPTVTKSTLVTNDRDWAALPNRMRRALDCRGSGVPPPPSDAARVK